MAQFKMSSHRWRRSALAAAAGLCMASLAWGQASEGSIFGRTQAGKAVTITNVETGTTRQIQPEADGTFSFSKLPPGRYKVSAGDVTKEVSVAIGSGTEVVLDDTNRVQIVGSRIRAIIDMSSAESNSVFTASQVRSLPVARNVDAVALLSPGAVRGDDFKGAGDAIRLPSFGGASIAENGYYVNGLDVTNIRNFLGYAQLPDEATDQYQFKTGGFGAEYGRSLGGVVSIVTKRGTNEWKGGIGFTWEPKKMRAPGTDFYPDKEPERVGLPYQFNSADTQNNMSVVLYGGGPLIKDKLFFFGAVEQHDDKLEVFDQSSSYSRHNTKPNGMIKLDWSLTNNHQVEYTFIESKKKYTYYDYDSATPYSPSHDGPAAISSAKEGGNVHILKYTGYLTDDLTVSALAGKYNDKRRKFVGARTLGEDCPVVLEVDTSEIGCWEGPFPGNGRKDPTAPDDEDKRSSFRFDLEYKLGAHTLKAGIDNQTFKSSEAGGSSYTGPDGGMYWRYFVVPANGRINGVNGFTPGTEYVRRRLLRNTSGTYEVKNSAFYIEDSWKLTKQVMVYGGLRWEKFENKNGADVSFIKSKNLLAPRTGFTWDMNGDGSFKVYGNAGRYYIPVAANTNIRATRAELFEQRFFQYGTRDPRTQGPIGLGPEIGAPQIVSNGVLPNPGTIADTKLKPMNQDEFILGMQKAVAKDLVFGMKAVYRKVNDGMDDYCGHEPIARWAADQGYTNFDSETLAPCVLMNPGRQLNLKVDVNNDGKLVDVVIPNSYLGLAQYSRTYKALELSLERPWDGKWSMNASYTWAKSQGTAEGYVQSNLDQDDAGITQDFDFGSFSDGSKGYLPNDRRHTIKLYGNYQLADEWRLGFNAVIQSGRPISCIGFVPESVPDFADAGQYTSASAYYCIKDPNKPAQLVNRGSVGRTPWTRTLDLSLEYTPNWAGKKLTIGATVFNVFNANKPTEVNEVRDFSRADSLGAPPYRIGANYLSPTSFQDPRYVRITARYEF